MNNVFLDCLDLRVFWTYIPCKLWKILCLCIGEIFWSLAHILKILFSIWFSDILLGYADVDYSYHYCVCRHSIIPRASMSVSCLVCISSLAILMHNIIWVYRGNLVAAQFEQIKIWSPRGHFIFIHCTLPSLACHSGYEISWSWNWLTKAKFSVLCRKFVYDYFCASVHIDRI